MEQPKKNEHWHIQYGANVKTNIIVKVLTDKTEYGLKNWTKDNIKCDRLGEEIMIKGELFVEKFANAEPKLRVFSNPSWPA
ncbi:MAG: hypothetical protein IID16_01010 [Candidatus Marinimicrobia bacterium]|nr:hypothetical protein [Candidatus Neomarinimicrobiota bacterium]